MSKNKSTGSTFDSFLKEEGIEVTGTNRSIDQSKDIKNASDENDDLFHKELKKFLIPKLRSASYRWPARSEAIKRARKSRGIYQCEMCGTEMKNKEFICDHKEPVVPLTGWDGKDWTQYVTRMFCKSDNFQIICKSCSTIKTDTEVQLRKMYRERKKNEQKS